MRKFLALGATAFSAVALTLVPASPAHALPIVDNGMITSLCSTLPGTVVNLGTAVATSTLALGNATLDNGLKQTALATSTTGLVTAVVNHVLAANTNSDVSITGPAVGTAVTDYAAKTVAAGAAFDAMTGAQRLVTSNLSSQAFAAGVSSGLCII
ncbi:MAG: hypothetical protein QOH36_704 [Actinomycetota bacterium]|jgi:hypothetical protein|nr:hypothetical protein [Actinomycetota bacterium]MEA2972411.1 hypothetical protein [Actinomycetota bacterium]